MYRVEAGSFIRDDGFWNKVSGLENKKIERYRYFKW
jgi:hypothetical protein